jgi:hypothetical protein
MTPPGKIAHTAAAIALGKPLAEARTVALEASQRRACSDSVFERL